MEKTERAGLLRQIRDADRDFIRLEEQVWCEAENMAISSGWCNEGLNDVLVAMGLPRKRGSNLDRMQGRPAMPAPRPLDDESFYTDAGLEHLLAQRQEVYKAWALRAQRVAVMKHEEGYFDVAVLNASLRRTGLPEVVTTRRYRASWRLPRIMWTTPAAVPSEQTNAFRNELSAAIKTISERYAGEGNSSMSNNGRPTMESMEGIQAFNLDKDADYDAIISTLVSSLGS